MIQAVYFDVDGTLVSFRTHEVPSDTIAALRMLRAAGVYTLLCTGRNVETARPLIDTGLFDGVVALNGQYCTLGGKLLRSAPIPRRELEIAVAGAEAGELTLDFAGAEENFMNRVDEWVLRADAFGGMPPIRLRPARDALRMPIYQFHLYGPPGSEDALIRRAPGLVAARWSENFADVYPAGSGKESGMAAVSAALGLPSGATMAFGDGENDIGMLRAAGIGVAMGNASDAVKAAADYVTASVDEGGILRAVRAFRARLGISDSAFDGLLDMDGEGERT